jgi:hypothetical protein
MIYLGLWRAISQLRVGRRNPHTLLAKVGVVGSNPIARSKSLDLNNLLI